MIQTSPCTAGRGPGARLGPTGERDIYDLDAFRAGIGRPVKEELLGCFLVKFWWSHHVLHQLRLKLLKIAKGRKESENLRWWCRRAHLLRLEPGQLRNRASSCESHIFFVTMNAKLLKESLYKKISQDITFAPGPQGLPHWLVWQGPLISARRAEMSGSPKLNQKLARLHHQSVESSWAVGSSNTVHRPYYYYSHSLAIYQS